MGIVGAHADGERELWGWFIFRFWLSINIMNPDDASLEWLLQCPISLERMKDPVVVFPSGHSYDRKYICQSLLYHPNLDPKSGVYFEAPLRYTTNFVLRNILQEMQSFVPHDDSHFEDAYKKAWHEKIGIYKMIEQADNRQVLVRGNLVMRGMQRPRVVADIIPRLQNTNLLDIADGVDDDDEIRLFANHLDDDEGLRLWLGDVHDDRDFHEADQEAIHDEEDEEGIALLDLLEVGDDLAAFEEPIEFPIEVNGNLGNMAEWQDDENAGDNSLQLQARINVHQSSSANQWRSIHKCRVITALWIVSLSLLCSVVVKRSTTALGTKRCDCEKRFNLTKQDAFDGSAEAQFNLGWLYAHGYMGEYADYDAALRWYEKATVTRSRDASNDEISTRMQATSGHGGSARSDQSSSTDQAGRIWRWDSVGSSASEPCSAFRAFNPTLALYSC